MITKDGLFVLMLLALIFSFISPVSFLILAIVAISLFLFLVIEKIIFATKKIKIPYKYPSHSELTFLMFWMYFFASAMYQYLITPLPTVFNVLLGPIGLIVLLCMIQEDFTLEGRTINE